VVASLHYPVGPGQVVHFQNWSNLVGVWEVVYCPKEGCLFLGTVKVNSWIVVLYNSDNVELTFQRTLSSMAEWIKNYCDGRRSEC
jgi:hypothetical protein